MKLIIFAGHKPQASLNDLLGIRSETDTLESLGMILLEDSFAMESTSSIYHHFFNGDAEGGPALALACLA